MDTRGYTRRGFVASSVAVFSGCLGGGDEDDCEGAPVGDNTTSGDRGRDNRTDADDTTDGSPDNATDGADEDADEPAGNETDDVEVSEDSGETEELDLREANVMAVTFRQEGDGTHTFNVTLYHDDDGEDGYANWWQVESLEGDCLGRRVLTHAHGTRRFTRSETIETGEETCVVVRGHDQTHGYGGRAVLIDLETGVSRGLLQGEEPSPFDEGDCP